MKFRSGNIEVILKTVENEQNVGLLMSEHFAARQTRRAILKVSAISIEVVIEWYNYIYFFTITKIAMEETKEFKTQEETEAENGDEPKKAMIIKMEQYW